MRMLVSLYGQEQGLSFEVILVDNDSNDGTVEAVRREYPQVRVLANRGNVGFAHANNQALELARGDLVLYLNPDTEVGPDTLRRCADELRSDPTIGMVGCRLLYPDGSIQYEAARRHYRLTDLLIETPWLHQFFPKHPFFGRVLIGEWDHTDTRDVEAISGAYMMLSRELATSLGGMSEEVFLYHEDLNLCLRVLDRGLRIRYLADVWTIHHTNRSTVGRWNDPDWSLLEVETKHRLVRELQGPVVGAAARAVLGVRAALRTVLASVAAITPGTRGVRARYPTVFNPRRHAAQVLWSISPRLVAHRIPRAPAAESLPAPVLHDPIASDA